MWRKHTLIRFKNRIYQSVVLLSICSLLIPKSGFGQSFHDFITDVTGTAPPLCQAKVDSFMQANTQFPLTEFDTLAHYVLTGNYNSVDLAGDINGWQTGMDALVNISNTNFWYVTHVYPNNARLDYKFVTNGSNWILDPNNPNQVSGGYGPNSELAMPQYVQPWEIEDYPNVPNGTIISTLLYSSGLDKNYQIKVYLPPNYDSTQSYPVAYFHDGLEYISLASADNILDNLIDSNLIEPLIGVFVKPNDRGEEYAFSQRYIYRDFFVDDLVPWVDSNWATRPDSSNRATIGASFGANISAIIAYTRPDVFYKTGQHSGAWWPNGFEVLNLPGFQTYPNIPMASVWGAYEGGLTDLWRILEDSMTYYGAQNKYFKEYPEGHSWGLWRATLDEMLIELFPYQSFGIQENYADSGIRVYPNPATEFLTVEEVWLEIPQYEIYDMLGRVVKAGVLRDSKISVTCLKAGLYTLRLTNRSRSAIARFVVN
jgi:enterochelin esterase-like enzyme